MVTYNVDTAAAIRKLKDADCSEPLAEAIVSLVAEREEELATKADIKTLQTEIQALKAQLTARIWIAVGSIVVLSKAWDYFFPLP